MPTCESCNSEWSWKQTIKKTTTLNSIITCPHCEEKQFQTQKSKMKVSFLTSIVLLPLLIQIFFDIPAAILLSLFPVLFFVVVLLYPFLIKVGSEEEFMNFFEDEQ